MNTLRNAITFFCLTIFLLPTLMMGAPVSAETSNEPSEDGWWVETTVDRNQNKIGDMVELHKDNPIFLDEFETLPLIIDFDHTPGQEEIDLLVREVNYQHQ
ncbi:MAG: hypothetical protein QNL81_01935, partial [Euryarchaeota archaeon]